MSPRLRVRFWAALVGIIVVLSTATWLLIDRAAIGTSAVELATPEQPRGPNASVTPAAVREPVEDPTVRPTGADQTRPVAVATPPEIPAVTDPSPPPDATGTPIPVAPDNIGPPTPVSLPAVTVHRAQVQVQLGSADDRSTVRDTVLQLDGVVHIATVTVSERTLGGVPAQVAQVDPRTFRSFTPQGTANHQPLWDRIMAGDVAVSHEFGTNHDVPLGARLATDVDTVLGEPQVLRVGAFATNGTPPVADAIVLDGTLPPDGTSLLYVALDAEASAGATVAALDDLGYRAAEILDPRAPRSETIVPAEGITAENVWDHLALCESSGDWHINTGNGYYGGIQFLPESWAMVGGRGLPHEHSREEQIYRGSLLWQIQGWEAWPQCARRLGLIVDRDTGSSTTPPSTPAATPVEVQPEE